MKSNKLYAVLTGDIISSTAYHSLTNKTLEQPIQYAFNIIEKWKSHLIYSGVKIYRGDSFQAVLAEPADALRTAIIIRTALRSYERISLPSPSPSRLLDCRIAIGIGEVDTIINNDISSALGEAFKYSGKLLDSKDYRQNIRVSTPWSKIDDEINLECALLDLIIRYWGFARSEVMKYRMQGMKQEDISKELGISQPAINIRLRGTGEHVVDNLCKRFEQLIENNIRL